MAGSWDGMSGRRRQCTDQPSTLAMHWSLGVAVAELASSTIRSYSSLPILLPSHSLAPDPNPPGYPGIHRNRLGGDKPFRSLPPSTSRKASAVRFVAQPCCSSRQLGPGLDAERCSRCACVGYCLAKAPCDLLRPLCSFRELRHRPDRASIAAASGGQAWRGWTARAASPPAAARVRT